MKFEEYIINHYCQKNKEQIISTRKEAQAFIELLSYILDSYKVSCKRYITIYENYLGNHLKIIDQSNKTVLLKDKYFLSEEATEEIFKYIYRNICICNYKEKTIQIGKMSHQNIEVYGLIKEQSILENIEENSIEKKIYYSFTSLSFEKFNLLLKALCDCAYYLNNEIYEKINNVLSPKNIKKIKNSRILVQYK